VHLKKKISDIHRLITKTRQNIENVKHDLRNTHTVDFADLVKTIMHRETSTILNDTQDKIQKDFQGRKKEIDAEYDKILGKSQHEEIVCYTPILPLISY